MAAVRPISQPLRKIWAALSTAIKRAADSTGSLISKSFRKSRCRFGSRRSRGQIQLAFQDRGAGLVRDGMSDDFGFMG